MASRFAYLAELIESARRAEARQPVERPSPRDREAERREREAYRRQSRQDIADGRRMFLEQQAARQADPEAEYWAHVKRTALAIANAGRRRRGLPLLSRLTQDDQSPEYPDQFHTPDESPDEGDDAPNPPNKSKKKVVKKKVEDDGDDDEPGKPVDEGETEAQYWGRVHVTAAAIVAVGKRRRGEI
jgi:hypothetical protein